MTQWYKKSHTKLESDIRKLIPLILAEVQKVYDDWEQDENGYDEFEYGSGGICDAISQAISSAIVSHSDIETTEGGQEGDDHSWLIAYRGNEGLGIDISANVYEIGSGYSWKKKPNVKFKPDDIDVFPIDMEGLHLNDEYRKNNTTLSLSKNKIWHKNSAKTKAGREEYDIFYHGTSVDLVPQILSEGLIPFPKKRTWSEDKATSSTSPSRASLGGVYVTQNLLTATSSGRKATEVTRKKTDTLSINEAGVAIVVMLLQPKSLVADEDDLASTVSSVFSNYNLEYSTYHTAELYFSLLSNNEYFNDQKEKYKDKVIDGIKLKLGDLNENLENTVRSLLDDGFALAVKRKASYALKPNEYNDYLAYRDKIKEYMSENNILEEYDIDFKDFKERFPEYEDTYSKFYNINDWKSRAHSFGFDYDNFPPPPDQVESENEFRVFLDSMTKTLKNLARSSKNKHSHMKTGRMLSPIGFSGSNKILAVLEYFFDKPKGSKFNILWEVGPEEELIIEDGNSINLKKMWRSDFLKQYNTRISESDVSPFQKKVEALNTNWYKTSTFNNKKLYVMRGLPVSGKSHVAEQIVKDGGVVFSTDDFWYAIGNGKYEFDANRIAEAHQWNQKRAKEAIAQGVSPIVIDNTNIKSYEPKEYVNEAINNGYEIEVVEPSSPWAFDSEELARKNTHGVTKDQLDEFVKEYDRNITVEDIMNSKAPWDTPEETKISLKKSWYKTSVKYISPKNQKGKAPIFNSYLSEKLKRKLSPNTNAKQILDILNSKDFGVNRSEIEWSGILEWLSIDANKNRTIKSEEVLNFVEDSSYEIKETLPLSDEKHLEEEPMFDSEPQQVEPDKDIIESYIEDNMDEMIDRLKKERNYNEEEDSDEEGIDSDGIEDLARLRLKQEAYSANSDILKYTDNIYGYYILYNPNEQEAFLYSPDGTLIDSSSSGKPVRRMMELAADEAKEAYGERIKEFAFEDYVMDGDYKNYNELLFTFDNRKDKNNAGAYKSPHFVEQNILAHVRFDTRENENGDPILFIEEIQSDMNQSGRNNGFYSIEEKSKAKKLFDEKSSIVGKLALDINNLFRKIGINEMYTSVTFDRLIEMSDEELIKTYGNYEIGTQLISTINEYKKERKEEEQLRNNFLEIEKKSPDNPLKNTEAWVGLVLKRMLRWAAENNINQIAWTSGEEQSERYNLSKSFDTIEVVHNINKKDDNYGNYKIIAYKDGKVVVEKDGLKKIEDLDDYIGFEARVKIQKSEPVSDEFEEISTLEGEDLKFHSDSGMVSFYDKIVPNVAKKIAKKYKSNIIKQKIPSGWDRLFRVNISATSNDVNGRKYVKIMASGELPKELMTEEEKESGIKNIYKNDTYKVADNLIFRFYNMENKFYTDDKKSIELLNSIIRNFSKYGIKYYYKDVFSMEIPENMKEEILNKGQYIFSSKNSWYKTAAMSERRQFDAKIPEKYMDTIGKLSNMAHGLGLRAYAVGGFVRDLLIGREPKDLDIMVDVPSDENSRKRYIHKINQLKDEAILNPVKFIQDQITGAKKIIDVKNFEIKESKHRPEFNIVTCDIDYVDTSSKKPKTIQNEPFETSLNPSQLFAKEFGSNVPRGEAFGIFAVKTDVGEVEVAYPRTEIYEGASRKPRTGMGTLQEDANRRDFSMNAMFLDLHDMSVVDGSGHGLEDIQNKTIKITDPEAMDTIFKDDPLRVLRAIRQSAQLGFSIDNSILNYVKNNPNIVAMKGTEITWDDETLEPKLSAERIAEETKKIMSLSSVPESMSLMNDLGIINHVFLLPKTAADWKLDQINPHHYENVWDHTITVMKKLREYLEESGSEVPKEDLFRLNMAAFLHDTGKLIPIEGYQDVLDEGGNVVKRRFSGHPKQSTQIAENVMARLKYPNKIIEDISNLVRLHDEALGLMKPNNRDYLMVKLIKDIGKQVFSLLQLAIADRRAHIEGHNNSDYLENILKELPTKYDEYEKITKSFINGKDIQDISGFKSGKWMGILVNFLEESQMRGLIKSPEDAKDLVLKLSIVCKKINKDPDEWIKQVLPSLLSVGSDEKSLVDWIYSASNKLVGEGNAPLIEKYITGKDVLQYTTDGPKIGQILSESLRLQLNGEDELGNPFNNREDALLWLENKFMPQIQEPQMEEQTTENIDPNEQNKMAFSDRNQRYAAVCVSDQESTDVLVDVVIEEHELFLKGAKKDINWNRIGSLLNDDDFLGEMKSFSSKNPKGMYETYCGIRDENILRYVSDILDFNLKIAQGGGFDTSQLESIFGPDIVNNAKSMAVGHRGDLFSNIQTVGIKSGDFLGVYEPGENKRQNLEEYFKSYGILNGEDDPQIPNEVEKADGTFFSVNPDKIMSEKDNLINDIISRGEINQDDPNFQTVKKFNEDQILTLILAETLVHESVHSKTDNNGQPLGESEAKAEEVSFLRWAIPQMEGERQQQGLPPLGLEIK